MNLVRVIWWSLVYYVLAGLALERWPGQPFVTILSGAILGEVGRVVFAAGAGLVAVRIR